MVLHRIDTLAISSNYTPSCLQRRRENVYVPEKKEMDDTLSTMIEEHLGVVAPGPYQSTDDVNIVAHIFNCVAWQGSHYVNIVKLMCILQKHLEDFTFHVVL
jgi:hypothetical protein